ncbi:MAG TPA: hypothetical protein VHB02_06190 [Acidimicrobiales bacterium]|nr:hypothetical protein [Acidimicrobiales bacterium]
MIDDHVCSSDEAISALRYLTRIFGGYEMSEDDQRAYLKAFRRLGPNELQEAIHRLYEQSSARPLVAVIAEEARAVRRQYASTVNPEPWPDVDPETTSRGIEHCRRLLAGKVRQDPTREEQPMPTEPIPIPSSAPTTGVAVACDVLSGSEAGGAE